MALTSMPYLTIQELDANGNPYAGAKLFFYEAGTSTKQNTYADANGNTANANPVILDAAGRATIFWLPLTYDVVLAPSTDTDPPTSPYWTRSGITAVPLSSSDLDIVGTAGEALSAGDAVYLSDGSGSKTAGEWYLADADNTYSSTLAPQIGMVQDAIASGASGSIRNGGRITGLAGLTPGTLYYISGTAGDITSSAPANAMPIAVADSTTSVILRPPTPLASATVAGLLSTGAQTIAGAKAFTSEATFAPAPLVAPGTTVIATMPATVGGVFYKNTTTVNSSTGGAVNAVSTTISANSMSANGKTVRLTMFARWAANGNNKQITVTLGGTNIFDSGVYTGPGTAGGVKLVVEIMRTGASAQRVTSTMFNGPQNTPGSGWSTFGQTLTAARDMTADQALLVTFATAVANADLIHDGSYAEFLG